MAVSGKYILDTNIVIALFAGEQSVLDHLRDANEVYIPSVVIGELYYGAQKSSQASNNQRRIEAFIASNIILACDAVSAFHYGNIKEQLRQKGKPIPENDIWIAAIALQFDGILVSRDEHFSAIQDLTVECW
jgi:tRNA(fMet)-specific endonuclease VapC